MRQPHWETLTPATLQAFHQVARLPFITSFYLAGGTTHAADVGSNALVKDEEVPGTPGNGSRA